MAACAFEKTASFRTQLSTYSRRFITSVEHENSGEHEISDLNTDLSLSLSTVYNLGPWLHPDCRQKMFKDTSVSLYVVNAIISCAADRTTLYAPFPVNLLSFKETDHKPYQICVNLTRKQIHVSLDI